MKSSFHAVGRRAGISMCMPLLLALAGLYTAPVLSEEAATPPPMQSHNASTERWGPLVHLVGSTWVFKLSDGTGLTHRFTWAEGGEAILFRNIYNGSLHFDVLFRPGPQPGTLIGTSSNSVSKKTKDLTYRIESDEVLVSDWFRSFGRSEDRNEISFISGVYDYREASGKKGVRPDFSPHANLYKRYSPDETAQIAARTDAKFQAALAENTRQYEQEKAEQKQRRAEILNNVLSATTTVMAATGEVLAESNAQYSSSAAMTARGATGGPATYAKLPPVDTGEACSGFTADNYRSKAVIAPGDDAHLYAACGQTFELYRMYENAILQGYSEAESQRTYDAHRGAAANAMHYYQTRRAR